MKKIGTFFLTICALCYMMEPFYLAYADTRIDNGYEKTISAYPSNLTSRETPAVQGMTVYSTSIQNKNDCYTELTLNELYSGKEAAEIAKNENKLNVEPKEGTQYIIARFKIRFQAKDQNDYLMLYADHFTIVTKKGNVIKRKIGNLVFGFNTDDQIYSGAETILDVPLLVPKSQDKLLLNYWNAWFLIYTPPIVDPISGISFDMSMKEAKTYLTDRYALSSGTSKSDETFDSIIAKDAHFLERRCNLFYYINKSSDIMMNTQGTIYVFFKQNDENTMDVYNDLLGRVTSLLGDPEDKSTQWENGVRSEDLSETDGVNQGRLSLSHMWNTDDTVVYIGNITDDVSGSEVGTLLGLVNGEIVIICGKK